MYVEGGALLDRLAVIAVDGGGTKTEAALVTMSGQLVRRVPDAGPTNYHSVGLARVRDTLEKLVSGLCKSAQERGIETVAVTFGLSGLDRPKDEERLARVVDDVAHAAGKPDLAKNKVLLNDTFLILRAGSKDGTGVAVVCGTGTNTVGRDAFGNTCRVGGIGPELGDIGGASEIALRGLRAARRGEDGRGKPTALYELFCRRLGIQDIKDLLEFMVPDGEHFLSDFGAFLGGLAPVVFEAAAQDDEVARELLCDVGRELGLCVRLAARKLFRHGEEFTVVMGGGVLEGAQDATLRTALQADVGAEFPQARFTLLDRRPVLGGVLLAAEKALDVLELTVARDTVLERIRQVAL